MCSGQFAGYDGCSADSLAALLTINAAHRSSESDTTIEIG